MTLLVFSILIITLIDSIIVLYGDHNVDVNSILMDFRGTSHSDAFMTLKGRTNLFLLHSNLAGDGTCQAKYSEKNKNESQLISDFAMSVITDVDSKDTFEVNVYLQDTNYTNLRHFVWEVNKQESNVIQASYECDLSLKLRAFGIFPFTYNYITRDEIDMSSTRFNDNNQRKLKSEESENESYMSQLPLYIKQERSEYLEYQLEFPTNIDFMDSLQELKIAIPGVNYNLNLTKMENDVNLVFSTSEVITDVVNTEFISLPLTLGCQNRYENASCTLAEGVFLHEWIEDIKGGKLHLSATSQDSSSNFISKLLGESHAVTGRKYYPESPLSNNPMLLDQIAPKDSDISGGAECVVLDGDSVYNSFTCYTVEKGFMMSYIDFNDEDGQIGYLKGVTSWTTDGPFGFVTNMDGMYKGRNIVIGSISFSEESKNASLLFDYFDNGLNRIHWNTLVMWDIASINAVNISYSTNVENMVGQDELRQYMNKGSLMYGQNKYFAQLFLSKKFMKRGVASNDVVEMVNFVANGGYGGPLTDW